MKTTANEHAGICGLCCTPVAAGAGRVMTAGGRQVPIHAAGQCPPVVWIMETGEANEGGNITGVYMDRELAHGDFVTLAIEMCDRFGERAPDLAEMGEDGRLRVEVRCDWLTLTAWPVRTATAIEGGQRMADTPPGQVLADIAAIEQDAADDDDPEPAGKITIRHHLTEQKLGRVVRRPTADPDPYTSTSIVARRDRAINPDLRP